MERSVLVAQSCLTLCNPPRLLCPWDSPGKNIGMGCRSLLHGIFLIQESNPGLLHCRGILSHLSHQENPSMKRRQINIQPPPDICICALPAIPTLPYRGHKLSVQPGHSAPPVQAAPLPSAIQVGEPSRLGGSNATFHRLPDPNPHCPDLCPGSVSPSPALPLHS